MGQKKETEFLKIKPKKLTASNFRKFGYIIQWEGPENKQESNQFRIVLNDYKAKGWRIAYLIVRKKQTNFLERHPYSYESFEPIKGKAILFVCTHKNMGPIEAFILDKPIILHKGIWHNVLSTTKETHIKITENSEVKLIKQPLLKMLKV